MIRFLSLLLVIGISLATLPACKKKSGDTSQDASALKDAKPVKGDWMVLKISANPAILNPVLNTDVYSSMVTSYVFDALISYRISDGEFEGKLAKEWTVAKDGLSYDFTLRDGATFHDGKPITAEDVKFSFDIIKNPKVDAAHLQNYYQDLDSVEILAPNKVRFKVKKLYFKNLALAGGIDILPKHIYGTGDFNKHPKNRAPIGSGPYRFKKWEEGRSLELERNRDWWGLKDDNWKDRHNFNKILFRIISEPDVALMALKKGEIDTMEPTPKQWMHDLDTPDIEQKFYKLKVETEDGTGYGYIGWNLRMPLFQSKKNEAGARDAHAA